MQHTTDTQLVLSHSSKKQLIYMAQIPVPSVAPPPALQTSHHIRLSHPTQLEVHMQTDGPGKPQPLIHLLTEVLTTSRPSSGAAPHTLPTNWWSTSLSYLSQHILLHGVSMELVCPSNNESLTLPLQPLKGTTPIVYAHVLYYLLDINEE